MANDDKLQNQQNNREQAESNAERDQDHGSMNNGTIGGNMGTIGDSKNEDIKKKTSDEGDDTSSGAKGES